MKQSLQNFQMSLFDIEEETYSEDSFVKDCLRKGSGFCDGKYRINHYVTQNKKMDKFPLWLKQEYGLGGSFCREEDILYDSKGWQCKNDKYGYKVFLSWEQVAQKIVKLVLLDKYYSETDVKCHKNYVEWLINDCKNGRCWWLSEEEKIKLYNGDYNISYLFHYLNDTKDVEVEEEDDCE